jgi:hypothetical protein
MLLDRKRFSGRLCDIERIENRGANQIRLALPQQFLAGVVDKQNFSLGRQPDHPFAERCEQLFAVFVRFEQRFTHASGFFRSFIVGGRYDVQQGIEIAHSQRPRQRITHVHDPELDIPIRAFVVSGNEQADTLRIGTVHLGHVEMQGTQPVKRNRLDGLLKRGNVTRDQIALDPQNCGCSVLNK